jgi:heme-degrading monooxygenase HmoA
MNRRTASLALATLSTAPALAQTLTPTTQGATPIPPLNAVATVVKVPTPWYAPRSLVTSRMRDTVGLYASLPGLAFKAFSLAQADRAFGGLYLWQSEAAANAWFNPAWFERVERERGSKADVRSLQVSHVLDNTPGGIQADLHSGSVSTLVSVPMPTGMSRDRLVHGFGSAVAQYRLVPGLLRKHFTLNTADNTFGGVYLWRDEAAARQWFNEAWHARVRATYGAEGRVEWFDTPILLPTAVAANQVPTFGPV